MVEKHTFKFKIILNYLWFEITQVTDKGIIVERELSTYWSVLNKTTYLSEWIIWWVSCNLFFYIIL